MASGPRAGWALGAVSFAESSFFPIPPDAMLVPMILARPERAYRLALIATVTSVVGGIAGYAIGYFLYESLGRPIIEFYGYTEGFEAMRATYREWGLWIILIKGFTPIPYKIVTIASGVSGFALGPFILASILTRGARFFLIALLLRHFGEPIRVFIERRLTLITSAFVVLIIAGFAALKFI